MPQSKLIREQMRIIQNCQYELGYIAIYIIGHLKKWPKMATKTLVGVAPLQMGHPVAFQRENDPRKMAKSKLK